MAGGEPPGILALVDLIDEHPAAFAYDWRTRFGMSSDAVGEGMSWGEAWLLLRALLTDPSSHVSAAVAGWSHPISREALVIADLFDLTQAVNAPAKGRRPKPYPRPWKQSRGKPVLTRERVLSQEQIREVLARYGPEQPGEVDADGE